MSTAPNHAQQLAYLENFTRVKHEEYAQKLQSITSAYAADATIAAEADHQELALLGQLARLAEDVQHVHNTVTGDNFGRQQHIKGLLLIAERKGLPRTTTDELFKGYKAAGRAA